MSHHGLRAGLALTILLMLFSHVVFYSLGSNTGALFARRVMYCTYAFVTLLGGIYFSAAIAEEKQEGTMPLLRLTGASPMAILLGMSAPRLLSVLLLLLVMAPFLILSVTFGGVALQGVLTALLGMLTFVVMLSQLGLFASLISRNYLDALGRMLMLWLLIEFTPFWGWCGSTLTTFLSGFATEKQAQEFLTSASFFSADSSQYLLGWLYLKFRWIEGVTPELTLCQNLPLYLAKFAGDPIWRPQMTFHLVAAFVFLGLSRVFFESMTVHAVAGKRPPTNRLAGRTRKARRVSGDALTWKSWRWLGGGWFWFFFRLVGIPVGVFAVANGIAWSVGKVLPTWLLAAAFLCCGVVAFIADFAISLERVFSTEIQQRTLSSLLLLPQSRSSLIRRLIVGVVPAIVASTSCLVCGVAVAIACEPRAIPMAWTVLLQPWFYQVFAMLATTFCFGLFLSVRLRQAGMLTAIISLWFVGPIVVGSGAALMTFFVNDKALNRFFETAFPLLLMLIQIPFCFWMHRLLVRTLDHAGAQD